MVYVSERARARLFRRTAPSLLETFINDIHTQVYTYADERQTRRQHRRDQSHAVDRNLCLTEHLIKVTSLRQGRRIINVRDWRQQRGRPLRFFHGTEKRSNTKAFRGKYCLLIDCKIMSNLLVDSMSCIDDTGCFVLLERVFLNLCHTSFFNGCACANIIELLDSCVCTCNLLFRWSFSLRKLK